MNKRQMIHTREESEATQKEFSVADATRTLELTIVKVQKIKKRTFTPPNTIKVTLAGIVILMQDYLKQNGGEFILTMKERQIGSKNEENFFKLLENIVIHKNYQINYQNLIKILLIMHILKSQKKKLFYSIT